MDKLISSLAALQSNWVPKDSVSTFLPYIKNLFRSMRYDTIYYQTISEDFENKYGFSLPIFILQPIMQKMIEYGLVKRITKNNQYKVYLSKIEETDIDAKAEKFTKMYNSLIDGLYKSVNSESFTRTDSENTWKDFFNKHSNDVIRDANFLHAGNIDSRRSFSIGKYIEYLSDNCPELFNFITDVCIGKILLTTMYNEGIDSSSFNGVKIFLDTKFIFRLIGVEDEYYQKSYITLIDILNQSKAQLYYFKQVYQEVQNILNDSYNWIDNIDFDPSKASDITLFLRSKKKTKEYVMDIIAELDNILHSYNITEYPFSYSNVDYKPFESYKDIEKAIINEYRASNPWFDKEKKTYTIECDAKSVEQMYYIRNFNSIGYLNELNAVFITPNTGLVNAVKKFNKVIYPGSIPPVSTDIFIGMLVYDENLSRIIDITKNNILAYCHSTYKPSKQLVEKYVSELDRAYKKGKITESEYRFRRQHPMILTVLSHITKNNVENYSANTEFDVWKEAQEIIKAEERAKHTPVITSLQNEIDEKNKIISDATAKNEEMEKVHSELSAAVDEKDMIINNLLSDNKEIIARVSKMVTITAQVIIVIILTTFAIISKLNNWIASLIVTGILDLVSIILNKSIYKIIKEKIESIVGKWLS